MVPPDSSFHSHTRSRNFSRPMARRPGCWRSINCRSTTICVAMPAWSVPGCHSTSLAAHALEAAEHVLQRVVERMAHMQRAGDVGRRDDDTIRRRAWRARAGRRGRPRLFPCPRRCGLRRPRADRSCRSLSVSLAKNCALKSPQPTLPESSSMRRHRNLKPSSPHRAPRPAPSPCWRSPPSPARHRCALPIRCCRRSRRFRHQPSAPPRIVTALMRCPTG